MNPLLYRRPALEAVFIVTETIAWFIVIAVLATLTERAFVDTLADRLQAAIRPGAFDNLGQAEAVLADLRAASGRDAGPPLVVVLLTAAGGFTLMRLVPRLELGRALGSVVLVAATILGVNVLLHLAMGDLRVWDASRLAALIDPASQTASAVDLRAFVADPDVEGPHAGTIAVIFAGLILVWFRFMLAARSRVGFERMARSFTVSFLAVFVALFVARATEVDAAARYAVPQFVLGMLGLAIGNHERAVPVADAEERASPWMTSVGSTLALLAGAAAVIALLAYLRFGEVVSVAGDVLLVIIEFVAIIIVTPIFWVVTAVLGFLLGGANFGDNLPDLMRNPVTPKDVGLDEDDEALIQFPSWVWDSVKFFALVGVVYAMYWVGQRLLARRPAPEAVVDEVRERRTGGAGVGQLLADLVRFGRRRDPDRWLDANEPYRLFRRALHVSDDRGLTMLPSETPDEFAQSALVHLGSPPIADAARIFERVRFGRHDPSAEELRNATRALAQWDEANPATEEGRERIRGHRPISDVDSVRVRMALAKRGLNPVDDSILRGE